MADDDLYFPAEYAPESPTRNIISLQYNGVADGAASGTIECDICFQPGKDVMLPVDPYNACGPLCGYSLEELRAKSVWGANKKQVCHPCPCVSGTFLPAAMCDHRRRAGHIL